MLCNSTSLMHYIAALLCTGGPLVCAHHTRPPCFHLPVSHTRAGALVGQWMSALVTLITHTITCGKMTLNNQVSITYMLLQQMVY
jgi:hypothetical protein